MCLKPIKWPLSGPYGNCTSTAGHTKPVNKGPCTLKLCGSKLADWWVCDNCHCAWLEERKDTDART